MKTYQEIAEKWGVTPEQVKQLKTAMGVTWGNIAGDWFDCFESENEAYDSYGSEASMIAEATIDADRIRDYTREDMGWVYKMSNVMKFAQDVWNCRC